MSVIFDQLRISDDGKRFYINLHINNADYFNDIYLDSLTIMTADKVSETNPHEPTSDYIYKEVFSDGHKTAALVLTPTDMNELFTKSNFSSDLFFVYVKVKGIPSECTPCTLDKEITLGVTFDENVLHQKVMDYTKELTQDCKVPQDFIDFILLWNGFKSSIETEHYIPAINFYNTMFKSAGRGASIPTKNCGCHG